ncbi:MAG: hypothetical protein P9L94_17135, partial [Candidatus Hinthialibacter antarcticus]|nr:hypothetical protein [Candidatus Hinthialibacter antarcticus]
CVPSNGVTFPLSTPSWMHYNPSPPVMHSLYFPANLLQAAKVLRSFYNIDNISKIPTNIQS